MLIEITYNVTDVFMSTTETPVYVEISFEQPGGTSAVWGTITGTLSNQTDLQSALNAKVPYTGATGNVDLGEYELKAGQVEFDQTPTGTAGVGVMRWNDADGTVDLGLKGGNVTLQVGQEQVARVVNKTGANLLESEYKVVKVSSAQGQRLAVDLAQANNDNNSADTLGIVTENIDNNQEGFITTLGTIRGINTTGSLQGETWTDGDVLYLSGTTAGAITNVKPTAPLHIVVVGYVEYAHQNNGKIFVKVMNGWEIDELHNVLISSPTDNQGLFYNSTSTLWENKSITTALGYTPVPTTRNITINGVTYDLSADRTWTIAAGISGSGASGQVTYWTGASAVSGSNNLFWDNANGRLGIGTTTPSQVLHINNGAIQLTDSYPIRWGTSNLLYGSTTGLDITNTSFAVRFRFTVGGNFLINGIADSGQRLQVYGDTLLRGSGNTNSTLVLTAQNSDSANVLRVFNGGSIGIGNAADRPLILPFTTSAGSPTLTGTNLSFFSGTGTQAATQGIFAFENTAAAQTSGNNYFIRALGNYRPTSGTGTYAHIRIEGIINQTGGANGITRGIWIDPTLTAAADWRSIEWSNSTGWGLYGAGTANNYLGGNLGIGITPTVKLHVSGDTILRGSGATSATTALTVQNSSSTNLFTVRNDSRVGIATNAPTAALDVWNATDNAQLRISDSRVSIPNYSGVGFSPVMGANTLGFLAPWSSSTGGLQFAGFTIGTNTGIPFAFVGYHGGTSPTTAAVRFIGFKHDGSTNRTALTGSEIIAGFSAGVNADVLQVKANGRINMSSLPTSSTGLVAGDLWNDAGTVKIV